MATETVETVEAAMDQQVTISVKGLLAAGVVLLALAVAFLVGRAGTTTAQAAPAPAATEDTGGADPRTLTMRGEGKASVVPDQASFDVSVRMVRDDLESALDDSGAVLDQVLGRLERQGIARGDVETTGLEMSPVYDYPSNAAPVLRGYRVSQSVAVLVKRLGQAGRAITTAVDVGDNEVRVGDIQLRVGDPEAALARARTKAVDAATAKAQEYAEATGQELGDVMTLVEVQPEGYESQIARTAAYADSAELSSVPIRSGRSELAVTVQVVWELA
ncbi:MAG: SIMPL domain-containing protein [Nocardioidaceae bacterium]|nr:SIMPL domain-containing protein [Nocardioidaceae bacterium]